MGISVIGGSTSSGTTRKVARFTTEGNNTFTLPAGYDSSNPLYAEVTLVGAGGGAGCGWWTSTTAMGVAGGGGGGGVKKFNVGLTSNLTAHVGYRGYGGKGGKTASTAAAKHSWQGGNGGATFLGNGTPKNLFINPQCIPVDGQYQNYILSEMTPDRSLVPAVSGNALRIGSYGSGTYYKTQPYSVKPSTSYCFSHYAKVDGTSTQGRARVEWYTSDGTYISATQGSITTFTANTWTRLSVGDTSPSNATHAVFMHNRVASGSTSNLFVSNLMLEEGVTTPSTYCDGATSGYSWAGLPATSVTVSNSDVMYVASGGGGGGGFNNSADGTTAFNAYSLGYPGASSGGGATVLGAATAYVWGGHGGGAGTNATPHQEQYVSYSTTTNSLRLDSLQNYMNRLTEEGQGTHGQGYQGGAWSSMSKDTGKPGDGLFGFGKGGHGSIAFSTPSTIDAYSDALARLAFDAKANTGDGGNSGWYNEVSTIYKPYGGNGGSGYIEIVYWA